MARRSIPTLLVAAAASLMIGLWWGGARLLNYDTAYSLLWATDITHGMRPDMSAPLAPTPHPLATFVGLLLTLPGVGQSPPYGTTAVAIWELLGIAMLGTLGTLVFMLGRRWFGIGAGIVAAVVLLTREPVLSYGIRAYVDIPYICLLLAALLTESRRPRAGSPVLMLLALAGLLRPEAWLFTLAYLAWLLYGRALRPIHLIWAAAGPGLWALHDLLLTGDALHSLTGTRAAAAELGRVTGIQNVPQKLPFRLGEILREPGLLGATVGVIFSLIALPSRARLLLWTIIAALVAFTLMATAGMPILTRYLLGPAAILAIFIGAGICGWRRLAPGNRWRRPWQLCAVAVLVAFAVFAPRQQRLLNSTHTALATQRAILSELERLAPQAGSGCAVTVPNRRAVPQLALWTGRRPSAIRSAQELGSAPLPAFTPATGEIAKKFVLNRGDADLTLPRPPQTKQTAVVNGRWWTLVGNCTAN